MKGRDMKSKHGRILGPVVVVLVAALAVTLVACGGSGNGDGSTGAGEAASYLYVRQPLANWDPAIEAGDGAMVLMNVYETLLTYEPDTDSFTPVLAESYERSDDGKTWTFQIREGVKFHDGSEVDAEAVKFSVDRYMQINKGYAYIWAPVKNVEVTGPNTVVFNLKYPAALDLIVASNLGAFIISPTAVNAHPDGWLSDGNDAGSGPYMFDSWKVDQEVVLKQFPEYRGGWKDGQFQKVLIQKVAESTTKRQMIESGDTDIVTELPSEDYEALKGSASVDIDVSPSFKNLVLCLNTKQGPAADKKVRQALSYAFPYGEAIDYAAGGYASQPQGIVPTGMWGHSDSALQYTLDLEKAKQLLAQAGYSDGKLTLKAAYASGDEPQRKCLELYKAQLDKIGVNLEIHPGPWSTIWEQAKSKNPPQDMYVLYWWPTVCDPYDFLFNLLHTQKETQYNLSYWSNAEYDKLIDEGATLAATDRKAASVKYDAAQKIAMEEAPIIPMIDLQHVAAVRKDFSGYYNNPAYEFVVFFQDCSRKQ